MSGFDETAERRAAAASAECKGECTDALDRLWEYLDSELEEVDAATVAAHLAECRGCLEEYDVEMVLKKLVRRGCQEHAPDTLRMRIHERLLVMRGTTQA
jgi:mycothiol system anti-sigma-R factor